MALIAPAVLGALAGTGAYLAPMLFRRRARRRLVRACVRRRAVALTFDDGPGPELTPRVLDRLGERGAKATFFLLGERARVAPETAARARAAGHEIASHGDRHPNALRIAPWRAVADLDAGFRTIAPLLDGPPLYRPPYGRITLPVWLAARRRDAAIAWWTVVGGDTWPALPDPRESAEAVARAGGGVVLLHDFDRETPDAAERAEYVLAATDRVLDVAAREGIEVLPLGRILTRRSPRWTVPSPPWPETRPSPGAAGAARAAARRPAPPRARRATGEHGSGDGGRGTGR